MFERFINYIVPFYNMCRLRYTPSFTIHCVVYDTLRRLRYTPSCTKSLEHLYYILLFYSSSCIHSCTYPGVCLLFIFCISCVYPVYIFCISCVYPVYILCISCVYPAYILCMYCVCTVYVLCMSGTHSVLHLRSNLTFGTILPRILEQVLCPRYSTFYPFLLLSFIDVREIYDLHCILSYCVSFTIHYIRCSSCTHPTFIRCSSDIHPVLIRHSSFLYPGEYVPCMSCLYPTFIRHPFLSIIFGLILPSVISYRGF